MSSNFNTSCHRVLRTTTTETQNLKEGFADWFSKLSKKLTSSATSELLSHRQEVDKYPSFYQEFESVLAELLQLQQELTKYSTQQVQEANAAIRPQVQSIRRSKQPQAQAQPQQPQAQAQPQAQPQQQTQTGAEEIKKRIASYYPKIQDFSKRCQQITNSLHLMFESLMRQPAVRDIYRKHPKTRHYFTLERDLVYTQQKIKKTLKFIEDVASSYISRDSNAGAASSLQSNPQTARTATSPFNRPTRTRRTRVSR